MDDPGATVGLAELVTYHQQSRLDVKLAAAKDFDGLSVQLPESWKALKNPDDLSLVLVTANEPKGDADEDDGPRVLRIVRQPLAAPYQSALEFALDRLPGATDAETNIDPQAWTIAGSPAVLISQERQHTPSVQDMLSRLPWSRR